MIPAGPYAWLNAEPGPRMLLEAIKLHGTLETPGTGDNPIILGWADEVGAAAGASMYAKWAAGWYNDDSTPWCGLFMAVCAVRANLDNRPERRPPEKYLSAIEWDTFGFEVLEGAKLGDVLVFQRPGGGHVGMYVGEDSTAYHVLGGNQSDTVNVTRVAKHRCIGIRRVPYLSTPANVRKIVLASNGKLSTNEA
jgi:uncharacterized protein (TIGR02594 family)